MSMIMSCCWHKKKNKTKTKLKTFCDHGPVDFFRFQKKNEIEK